MGEGGLRVNKRGLTRRTSSFYLVQVGGLLTAPPPFMGAGRPRYLVLVLIDDRLRGKW